MKSKVPGDAIVVVPKPAVLLEVFLASRAVQAVQAAGPTFVASELQPRFSTNGKSLSVLGSSFGDSVQWVTAPDPVPGASERTRRRVLLEVQHRAVETPSHPASPR